MTKLIYVYNFCSTSAWKYCPYCGGLIEKDWSYCAYCGEKLRDFKTYIVEVSSTDNLLIPFKYDVSGGEWWLSRWIGG